LKSSFVINSIKPDGYFDKLMHNLGKNKKTESNFYKLELVCA